MRVYHSCLRTAVVLAAVAIPAAAYAQDAGADLMMLSEDALRSEVRSRYDDALALTLDPAVVSANTNQFMWASQAKAQCGIALGYLKSGTKDPVSVGKCATAHTRMTDAFVAAPLPPPPAAAASVPCNVGPYILFFDWDSAEITPDGASVLDNTIAGHANCSNPAMAVTGHTDRSGSNQYNLGLSARRADSVRNYLVDRGIDGSAIATQARGEEEPRVPTADGVRELQNRRVEIVFQ